MTDLPMQAPLSLERWFSSRRRDLPWRTPPGVPRDPWQTLLSETMSQQTRLEVVVPRFEQWLALWPSVEEFSRSQEEDALAAWAGLGYYSRVRNLLRCARILAQEGWPRFAHQLRKLPGVGPYTAAAIASFAFGEQVPMIDGNVLRVLSRVGAIAGDLHGGPGKRRLEAAATAWISGRDAAVVNEATMELGALVCLPRSPMCHSCPLAETCRACRDGQPERFPQPKPRREATDLEAEVLVLINEDRILLRRAGAGELLKGHWTLPERSQLRLETPPDDCGLVRHAITHHRIRWRILRSRERLGRIPDGMEWCPRPLLPTRLVSSLPRKALEQAGVPI
ncbi:MAG: A/G-specific adenine glycosylase [Fibrobacteria bacterium]|nr:A/G-specific adenine glycosylase [Fibrobacteria bacterium]